MLTLTGADALVEGDQFTVSFAYDPPDDGVEVVESVLFTASSTEAVVTLSATTTAADGMLEASVLDVDGATVEPALLAVEIAPRMFTLAFDPASIAIVAGGTTQTTLTLTGADALVEERSVYGGALRMTHQTMV